MVTKRYIRRGGKTYGPYYYESYRDENGNVRKRYIPDYEPEKKKQLMPLLGITIAIITIILTFTFFISQEISHVSVTGRTIYQGKEIYQQGEPIIGDIRLVLGAGESIPANTKVTISLADIEEEFILSDFVEIEPMQGNIYAEGSEISGEGMVFGIPGKKYQEIEFEVEIYKEEQIENEPQTSPAEDTTEEPTEETETPSEETQEEGENPVEEESTEETENQPEETEEPSSPITGQAISETQVKTITGIASRDNLFTYELEEGEKARIIEVTSNGEEISKDEISLTIEDNILTITTEYAIEGFGEEFINQEQEGMIFEIDVSDIDLEAKSGKLVIDISYEGNEIAYAEETILVSETEETIPQSPVKENNETNKTENKVKFLQDIPSIRIPAGENVVIDLSEYFSGAEWYSTEIANIDVSIEGNFLELTPEQDFKGARKTIILAGNDQESIESNEFIILVSSGAVNIKTTRLNKIVAGGEPIKWRKEIKKEQAEEKINIEIPEKAENVEIKKIKDNVEETIQKVDGPASLLTGNVVVYVNLEKKQEKTKFDPPFIKSFKAWFSDFRKEFYEKLEFKPQITGQATAPIPQPEKEETIDISLEDPEATDYVIEYVTAAPEKIEEQTEKGKLVTIASEFEGYTDVIAFADLPNTEESKIKLYWRNYNEPEEIVTEAKTKKASEVPEEEVVEEIVTEDPNNPVLTGNVVSTPESNSETYELVEIEFDAYDLDFDENGLIDYIEWVVPHLSNQTYEIIIEISNAKHLDENRTFISDIYDEVFTQDGIWSETIPENHHVRVTFEEELTSENDITVYPRAVSGTPQIEIYEENGTEIIASFTSLEDNSYNKVYLTNLQGPQRTFDLKIINGAVEFDHIIDPVMDVWCYQETANISTVCGGLNTGAYGFNYSGIDWSDIPALYDGNWSTSAGSTGFANMFVNYTKPSNANSSSQFVYKCNSTYEVNFTMANNATCWVQSPLQFKIYGNGGGAYTEISCWNSAQWQVIDTCTSGPTFHEEAMRWYLTDVNTSELQIQFTHDTTPSGNQTNNDIYVGLETLEYLDHYSFLDFNNDLLLWVNMNDLVNGAPIDNSSYENTVVNSSAINQNSSGRFGNAIEFSASDYLNVTTGNQLDFNASNEYTWSAWVYPRQLGTGFGGIISKCSLSYASGNGYSIYLNAAGYLTIDDCFGIATSDTSDDAVSTNEWSHVLINYTNKAYTFYVNGVESGRGYIGMFSNDNGDKTTIGRAIDSGVGSLVLFDGMIDEVLVFNRSLSGQEIKALYNASVNQYYNNFTGLEYNNTNIFQGFAVNTEGYTNKTEIRTVGILEAQEGVPIIFTPQTPSSGSQQNNTDIFINISTEGTYDRYSFLDFNNDVLVWMRMDDVNAIGTPIDNSTHDNTINLVGTPSQHPSGKFGKSFTFDGDVDFINISRNSDLAFDASGEYTWSVWVNPEGITSGGALTGGIIRKCNPTGGFNQKGYTLYLTPNGAINFGDCDTIATVATSTGTAALNTWTHIVVNYTNKAFTFYVNGSHAGSGYISSFGDEDEFDLRIGQGIESESSSSILDFNGTIDEFILFNRSLSESEIKALYSASANQYYNNFTNLQNDTYSFQGFAANTQGDVNQTETRTVEIGTPIPDTTRPSIELAPPTPEDNSEQNNTDIYVNLTTSDENDHYAFVDFDRGLLMWLRMDELTNGNPYDISSYGYNGTASNLTFSQGKFGDAADFNGLNWISDGNTYSQIELPTGPLISTNENFTFSAWFKKTNASGATGYQDTIYAEDEMSGVYFKIFIDTDNKLKVRMDNTTGGTPQEEELESMFGVNDEIWHHIVVTKSGSTYSLILDAVSQDTTNAYPSLNPTITYHTIGAGDYGGSGAFNGSIDEVLIFNRTLSSNEIYSLYSASLYQFPKNFTNLAENNSYTFQGFAVDTSGNKNQTEKRDVWIGLSDTNPPRIDISSPTPENYASQTNSDVFVNISTEDEQAHYSFVEFENDVLVWMRMDDVNASGDPTDLSSYSNNGTAEGNAAQSQTGEFGESFSFDGNGDYISMKSSPTISFHNKSNYTWSIWINPNSYNGTSINAPSIIFGLNNPILVYPTGYQLRFGWDNSEKIMFYKDTYPGTTYESYSSIPLNQWTHITITYEAGNTTYYINGNKDKNINLANSLIDETSEALTIGWANSQNSPPKDYFDGKIDEFIMFNRSLTYQEVKALYDSTYNQYYNNFTNLSNGVYSYQGFAVDKKGNKNETEERYFSITEEFLLNSCQDLTTPNSHYNLSSPITPWQNTGDCIRITAENITLDGKGFTIQSETFNNTFIYSNQSGTIIKDITIVGHSAYNFTSRGIFLYNASNSKLLNNNINGTTHGIYLKYTNNTNITNTYAYNQAGIMLNLYESSNNHIENIYGGNNTVPGEPNIQLNSYSSNNLIKGGKINGSLSYNLKTYLSGNNTIKDIEFYNPATYSLMFDTSFTNFLTNLTINRTDVNTNSEFFVRWYYQTYVNDSSGNPVANATVHFYNKDSEKQGEAITNASGYTGLFEITEYRRLASTTEDYSPYKIIATNTTGNGFVFYNVSQNFNKFDNVITLDTTPPAINFTSPTPSNGSSQEETNISINTTISDESHTYVVSNFDNQILRWYRFENASGNSSLALDSSKQGINGTIVNATMDPFGKFGRSITFTDTESGDSWVNNLQIPTNDKYNITVSAWIKTREAENRQAIFCTDGSADGGLVFEINETGYLTLRDYSSNPPADIFLNTQTLLDEEWHHVAFTFDYTGNSPEDAKIYYDGAKIANRSWPTTFSWPVNEETIGICPDGNLAPSLGFNGSIDEFIIFNYTLSDEEISGLYNATAGNFHTKENLLPGTYTLQSFAVDSSGNLNQTELRTFTIEGETTSDTPDITFLAPTPNDGGKTDNPNVTIKVNITTYNSTDLSYAKYRLFNSTLDTVNETITNNTNITWQDLAPGTYTYNVYAEDSLGSSRLTTERAITILPNCFELETECIEGQSCVIGEPCVMHNEICSDSECNFTLLETNATIHTLYDGNGNGRDLSLTLTSNTLRAPLKFLSGGGIDLSGRAGTDLENGGQGGSGGFLNITVPDLFNTTNANFTSLGGYTTASAGAGGDGGNIELNFHGRISDYDNLPAPAPQPLLTGGSSVGGGVGSEGVVANNKDLATCPRDADINNDGLVDFTDYFILDLFYAEQEGEENFDLNYDTRCDNRLNVIDMSKVGFEYLTRG